MEDTEEQAGDQTVSNGRINFEAIAGMPNLADAEEQLAEVSEVLNDNIREAAEARSRGWSQPGKRAGTGM